MHRRAVWIGFDPREVAAFAVAASSIHRHLTVPLPIRGIVLDTMRVAGLYTRPTEVRDGRLWDVISSAPMSTEFAISRFLVPFLCDYKGFALFMDCDMLVRGNLQRLFDSIDRSKAVTVVKHNHQPTDTTKMDGQIQTRYARKNWSSVMVFNCDHPSNKKLTPELVNTVPGRDLHAFCWLEDDEIGEMPVGNNWLVGHSPPVDNPAIVHFTDGIPMMPGYENVPYAEEWFAQLRGWGGLGLTASLLPKAA